MSGNILDIVGPIMIGPSSSHTAGAVRLSNLALRLFNRHVQKASFYLHGSFRDTYRGHGTDKALIGGILGFQAHDERIKKAAYWAKEANVEITIDTIDLGPDYHPNTVKIVLTDYTHDQMSLIGSSLGGARIQVASLDGFSVNFSGEEHLLIVYGIDKPGGITKVTAVLSEHQINIGNMSVARKAVGDKTLMTIEVDSELSEEGVASLRQLPHVRDAMYISPF